MREFRSRVYAAERLIQASVVILVGTSATQNRFIVWVVETFYESLTGTFLDVGPRRNIMPSGIAEGKERAEAIQASCSISMSREVSLFYCFVLEIRESEALA
jgi:hypothetical protein